VLKRPIRRLRPSAFVKTKMPLDAPLTRNTPDFCKKMRPNKWLSLKKVSKDLMQLSLKWKSKRSKMVLISKQKLLLLRLRKLSWKQILTKLWLTKRLPELKLKLLKRMLKDKYLLLKPLK